MRRLFLLGLLTACGSSVPPFASDDVAMFDGGGLDHTLQSDSPFEGSTFDVSPDGPKFGGGGPFLCNDCICDGTLNLCEHFSGGAAPMPIASDAGDAGDFGDASACVYDAGQTSCTPIPVDCLPNPSCACVMAHVTGPCSCGIDPSGNGIVVTCVYP